MPAGASWFPWPHPLIAAAPAKQMQSKRIIHIRPIGVLHHFQRPPARSPAKAGNQNAVAARILLLGLPLKGAAEAVETAAVLMMSVFLSAPPDAVNVTDGMAKLQEKSSGRVPQEKLTGPVNPPCGVMVRVTIPELAKGRVRLVGFTLAVKPGVTIVSVRGADVLWVKFASPPYVAWMVAVPAVGKDVVRVAMPLASVTAPMDAVPL